MFGGEACRSQGTEPRREPGGVIILDGYLEHLWLEPRREKMCITIPRTALAREIERNGVENEIF